MIDRKKFVAVIGSGQCSEEEARLAEEVGHELARHGAILVCGGLGGIMEAACKGASTAGGITIGILPGTSRDAANPYVTIPLATGIGYARNMVVAKSAQAVIAISGNYGTLSEISLALQSNIPVIGLRTWSLLRDGKSADPIILAQSPVEAVEKALELAID